LRQMSREAGQLVGKSAAMARWTADTRVAGPPEEVLALLTEPESISRWAPIDFELVDWAGQRLEAGDRVRVQGRLAGRSLEFDVDVAEADGGRLALIATGPIRLDVEYRAVAAGCGSHVSASIDVSGRGLLGRMFAQATDALLACGALRLAVEGIARELVAI
jgi:carbon monoxide dehydrogenase subunit G